MRKFVKHYPLFFFFALAYGYSWAFWLILIACSSLFNIRYDMYAWPLFWLTGLWGPSLSAIILTGLQSGKMGVRALLSSLVRWRVGLIWYLFALLAIPASKLLVFALTVVLGSSIFDPARLLDLTGLLPAFLFFLVYGAPLQEELGWRGYALPRLQERWGALMGSLLLGILWILWHLPLFWLPGSPYESAVQSQPFLPFFLNFAAYVLPSTFLFTWLYNNARGSVFLCLLLHAANNVSGSIASMLGVTDYTQFNLVNNLIIWLLAFIIIVATRLNLSWQKQQGQFVSAPV